MYTATTTRFLRWTGILVCVMLLMGALPVGAAAASVDTVSATISPDITIAVDDEVQTFFSAAGAQVHPVVYNGTTYLPLRAIGELMGKNVNWDQSALTITLSGTRGAPATAGTRDAAPTQQTIQAQLRPDFTIVVDGVSRTFTDAQGNTVYPLLYSGTTYLPLRAIGELMGKTVSWDPATRTAGLSSGSLVTDADSFGELPDATQPSPETNAPGSGAGSKIGEDQAKRIALDHAGLTESQVTLIHVTLELDDGRWGYDVEFYTAGYQEYDYEIDAFTGAILKFDYDAEDWSAPQQDTNASQIGIDNARSIALERAGLDSSQVTFTKAELEHDDGRWEYEIEFVSGAWEYECEIDAYSGAVLVFERGSIHDRAD